MRTAFMINPAIILVLAGLASAQPSITPGGVIGAGISQPPVIKVSPLGIVAIFGQDFAPAGTANTVGPAELVNGALPTSVANVCVTFNGTPAPLFGVYPSQINAQVPAVSGNTAGVQVTTGCGTAQAQTSNVVTVGVGSVSPEFLYVSSSVSNSVAAVNQSGALVGPTGLISGVNFVALNQGDFAMIYAVGLGATSGGLAPGQLETGADQIAGTYSMTIGGVPVRAADLQYVGGAPLFAGLYQINVRIGSYLPSGLQPVLLTVNGVTAPLGSLLIAAPTISCTLPDINLLAAVQDQLTTPGPVTINYDTDGATSISVAPLGGTNLPAVGSVTGTLSATTTVTLSAQNTCGTVTQSIPVSVGAPGVGSVTNAANPSLGSSAQPGQLILITPSNLSHPELVTAVAFTNAAGVQVQDVVLGVDASGNLQAYAPLIADPSVSQGYDTGAVTVSYILNGQAVPGIPMNVTALAYQGNAVADFASMIDQYYNSAVQTNAAWSNDPTFGPAAPGVLQTMNTIYAVIKQMAAGLAGAPSVQVPVDAVLGASAGTATVNASDIATLMAFNTNLIDAGRLVASAAGSTAGTATSPAAQNSAAADSPRLASPGCTPVSSIVPPGANPALGYCLPEVRASTGIAPIWALFNQLPKMIPFGAIAKASVSAAGASLLAAVGPTMAMAEAADIFCKISAVYLDPVVPFLVNPNKIPVGNVTNVTVSANFVSLNPSTESINDFIGDQFAEQVVDRYAGELEGLNLNAVKSYFTQIFGGTVTALLNELKLEYPAATQKALVGDCDIQFKPWGNKPLLRLISAMGTNWSLHGDDDGYQQMQIGPNANQFLCQGQPTPWLCKPFNHLPTAVIAVGNRKALTFSTTATSLDLASASAGAPLCTAGPAPSGIVTPLSPISLAYANGFGSITEAVSQVDDSTWHILLTVEEFGMTGDNAGRSEGCTELTTSVGVFNPPNATDTQAMIVTVNPDSSTISACGRDAIGGLTPGPLQAVVPGTYTVPTPLVGGTTSAGLNLNLGVGAGDFNTVCTLDVTVQLNGPDGCPDTGCAAAVKRH